MARGERSGRSSRSESSSVVIDPSKPSWWNEQKLEERRRAESERNDTIRSENERRKAAAAGGNAASYGNSRQSGGREIRDGQRVGAVEARGSGNYKGSNKGGSAARVGAFSKQGQQHQFSDEKDDDAAAEQKKKKSAMMNSDMMMDMQDDRINKGLTADEELQGRSIWDLGEFLLVVFVFVVGVVVEGGAYDDMIEG